MGKINVLDFEIANLIAAGEVVDRPASVLKELLENAIDAGGTHIVAEIQNGGIRSIRVSDNGCGMSSEDMPVALRRHATSKIKAAEDLNGIITLGFRGEALAAISAVSDVTIISKTKDAEMGTILSSTGGKITDLSEVGAADGTTVVVEHIFANVPARRKFLKKDMTEAMACTAHMEKIAMSHPEISFRFLIDGKLKFATSGDGDVKNVLYALYGRDFATRLLPVMGETDGIKVTGYVGRSDNSHGNRNMQNVFINARYVKSKTVMAALERAFTSYMAPERFPVCALYLEVDPRQVDVTVHPAKLEVRFSDERKVFEAVYWAVRGALEENTSRPEMGLGSKKPPVTAAFVPVGGQEPVRQIQMPPTLTTPPKKPQGEELTPAQSIAFLQSFHEASREAQPVSGSTTVSAPVGEQTTGTRPEFQATLTLGQLPLEAQAPKEEISSAETQEATPEIPEYRFVGQAFHTYLFVELGEELLVIDQHAAHERILFEELLRRQKEGGKVGSQGMLIPLRVNLTQEEYAAVLEAGGELEAVGFSFLKEEGGVSLVAIPDAVSPTHASDLFVRMAQEIAEGLGNPAITEAKRRERALYQIACKAAIKGGRIYDKAQLEHLIQQVLAMPDITVCPHGRPIAYRLTKREMDRQFDRIK